LFHKSTLDTLDCAVGAGGIINPEGDSIAVAEIELGEIAMQHMENNPAQGQ
jgi:hypothetical protein